jgi:hypothetical protein
VGGDSWSWLFTLETSATVNLIAHYFGDSVDRAPDLARVVIAQLWRQQCSGQSRQHRAAPSGGWTTPPPEPASLAAG